MVLLSLAACGSEDAPRSDEAVPPRDTPEQEIDRRFAIDADGRQLALLCNGEGSPTVLLEPGDGGSGDEFGAVMGPLGDVTRTCTYDRPGSGQSDPPSKDRRTVKDAVADLRALVEAAGVEPPFVHVGASAGGAIVLWHAARHPDDVAGVVLLDVTRDDPEEGAKAFPGAEAWSNPEHLDIVDAVRRVTRLRAKALTDTPLRVITAADGQSDAENQSYWLRLSSDAEQKTIPGGHDLAGENSEGVVEEVRALLDAIGG